MNTWSWGACCQKAVEGIVEIGINHAKNSRTVTEWHREFWVKIKFKVHGNKKETLPPFLQQNPNIWCTSILQFAQECLCKLGIESLLEYIYGKILCALVKDKVSAECTPSASSLLLKNVSSHVTSSSGEEKDAEYKEKLRKYGLTCIIPSTMYCWMCHRGFKYLPWQISYYVDGHKRPAAVEYQWAFVQWYLGCEQ